MTPEGILAVVTAIVGVIGTFLLRRVDAAEKKATSLDAVMTERIGQITAIYQGMITDLRAEMDREKAGAAAEVLLHKTQIKGFETAIDRLEKEQDHLRAENTDLRNQLRLMDIANKQAINQLTVELADKANEIRDLKQERTELRAERAASQTTIQELSDRIVALEMRLAHPVPE